MWICSRIPITDDDFGTSLEDRPYEVWNSIAGILIVSISIDDDVGSEHEPVHDTMMKCYTEASIRLEFDDMMDSEFSGYF